MKHLIIIPLTILSIIILSTSCNHIVVKEDKLETVITTAIEHAYFEGQKDALNGDIRIKRNNDSCYIWIKSPWDSNKEPLFDPSFNCN